RFHEQDVRDMGRTATGVWGIALDKKDQVVDLVVIRRSATLLAVTERGMGKRSELDEYRVQHRGGRGIITLKRNEKTGAIVALKEVQPEDELMMITKKGIMIRVPVDGIRVTGRNTQGVKVMNLTPGDLVVDVARIVKEDDEEENGDEDETPKKPKAAKTPKTARAAKAAKKGGGKKWGGEVVFAGRTSADRHHKAEALAAAEGLAVIPPFDHPDVVAGQATVGLEIAEDLPDVETVVVPVGGGGLISGVVRGLAVAGSDATVWGVEPAGAPKLHDSLAAGHPVTLERTSSVADGLITLTVG